MRVEIKISLTDCKSSKHSYNLSDAKTGSALQGQIIAWDGNTFIKTIDNEVAISGEKRHGVAPHWKEKRFPWADQ